jgi:hypothetical protein
LAIINCSKPFNAPATTEVILLPITEYLISVWLICYMLTPAISLVQWGEIAVLISHILTSNHSYNGYTVCFVTAAMWFLPFFLHGRPQALRQVLFFFYYDYLLFFYLFVLPCVFWFPSAFRDKKVFPILPFFEIQMGRNSLISFKV